MAIDAGGTSTRAVVVDSAGAALGYGRAGGGNPTSAGIPGAVAAVTAAAAQTSTGEAAGALVPTVIAMAGEQTTAYADQVAAGLAELGFGPVSLQPDLLGVFGSGTERLDGYALIAGTGTVAARVADGRLERVVGGHGWLLGDAGSGYWIGHRVARAVIAALDGQGPATALTDLVLNDVGLVAGSETVGGRLRTTRQLVSLLYSWRPVTLSRFAPLAFTAYADPVARDILVDASAELADLLAAVRTPADSGPVVVGGSVLVRGLLGAPAELRVQLAWPVGSPDLIPVEDGLVGAAVLALRGAGLEVDQSLFRTLQASVTRLARAHPVTR